MRFDYIRALDPPTEDEHVGPLEPIQPERSAVAVDEATLDDLVASACQGAAAGAGLATPDALGFELPSFLGASLACTRLELARPDDPLRAVSSSSLRASWGWRGPGIITMALAVVATLVFGALVITL